jgi:hypothetical protein
VPSTRDPILLLEPSNLLEPLNFEDQQVGAITRSTLVDRDHSQQFTRPIRREPMVSRSGGGWGLKSALIGMGAVVCFGAGTALPEFTAFRLDEIMPPRTVESATRPPAPRTEVPITSAELKPREPESNPSVASNSNEPIAPSGSGTASPTPRGASMVSQTAVAPVKSRRDAAAMCDQPGRPVDDVNCLAGGIVAAATSPTRADRNSDDPSPRLSQPATASGNGKALDLRRADVPASNRQEERDQSSSRNGNRRASSRDATVQQVTADANNATASSGDRRQEREINRGSSRRRDRTARDNGAAEGAWEREYDRTSDRTYDRRGGRRGNRYDEDRGAGARRIVSQAVREHEGIIARGPRYGGPMGLFSSGNNW